MKVLSDFRLEEYLAPREFGSNILFCGSDVESRSIADLLSLVSEEERNQFLNLSLKYTPTSGSPELLESLAKVFPGLQNKHFLCFAGAEEGIYTAANVLLKATDHAITITPCYQSLKSVAASLCEVSEISLEKENGTWKLDLEKLSSLIQTNTKVIFINFPNNPTGYIPSKQTFEELIQLARKRGIYLFSDEAYQGLSLNPSHNLPSASTLYERALSLGVMSKSFGLPGLRIGWISCQDEEILKKLAKFKHYLSICNSAPSEFLAKIAIDHREKIWEQNFNLLSQNFKLLREYFKNNENLFEWIQPQGGCICYPRYRGKERITSLADSLLKKQKVVILPDWVFEQDNNHFRLSYGRKNMPEALNRFEEFFKDLK